MIAEGGRLNCEDELARLTVRAQEMEFELELAHRARGRQESEVARLEQHISQLEADRAILLRRLEERDRTLQIVYASRSWRSTQWIRRMLGRR